MKNIGPIMVHEMYYEIMRLHGWWGGRQERKARQGREGARRWEKRRGKGREGEKKAEKHVLPTTNTVTKLFISRLSTMIHNM